MMILTTQWDCLILSSRRPEVVLCALPGTTYEAESAYSELAERLGYKLCLLRDSEDRYTGRQPGAPSC